MDPELRDAARSAARRHGTPSYLYDLPRLHADARRVAQAFPDPWIRLYSFKANGLPSLVRELVPFGYGASVVSGGELALAARAGVRRADTALEGIGKTPADLKAAAGRAVSGEPLLWVSVESRDEAAALAALVERARRQRVRRRPATEDARMDVLIRVNPGVEPETHRGLAVGRAGSKFGCLPEEMAETIDAGGGPDGHLRWRGIHLHVGSQLGAVDAWRSAFRVGLRLVSLQRAALDAFDTLDAGSGFPVPFGVDDAVPAPERFAAEAAIELEALAPDARPARLAIEPGRVVVAGCGWLVARVLHARDRSPRSVVLDGGMTELIRPALYGAEHPMVALTSLGRPLDGDGGAAGPGHGVERVLVDGPICESTDRLGEADLPALRRGDLVAIGVAGAYASSMASTYNGRPRAPELAWDGHRVQVLRRRGRTTSLP
jgi:diaminopimelate decarboxylase